MSMRKARGTVVRLASIAAAAGGAYSSGWGLGVPRKSSGANAST